MIKRKLLSFGLSVSTIALIMSGCQSSTSSGSSSTSGSSSSNAASIHFEDATLTGQVTKTDGDEITVRLGNVGGMGGNAPGSEVPTGDPSSQKDSSGTSAAESSSEDTTDNSSSGPDSSAAPAQPGGNANSSDNSDNTVTLTISDESVISVENAVNTGNPSEGETQTESDTATTEENSETATQGSLSDLTENAYLTISFDSTGTVSSIIVRSSPGGDMGQAPSGSGSSSESSGTSATTADSDSTLTGESYTSSSEDENALRIEGSANVTASLLSVTKTEGDTSSTENSDFYGQNAGILTRDGAALTLSNSKISTQAQGANGIFAYGEDSDVTVSDTTITTDKDNSGGIDAAGGASISASNLTIQTNGNSSAAIRSDRGGGNVSVKGGEYATNGTGSPAIYSTAEISVKDATLTANASEAVVVEGANSVSLDNCEVSGAMEGTYGKDSKENIHGIMLYQSMSGDAETGNSSFTMTDGTLINTKGDLFYVTNTDCAISLNNVTISNASDTLLTVAGNDGSRGWGSEGSNGGECIFSVSAQNLKGNISVDTISSLNLNLADGSTLEGSINTDNEGGEVSVTLDENSTWTLTGDTYITSLDGSTENVDTNGYTLYVDGSAYSA